MDALQFKVDSIGGEVSQISDALRGYLEHGLASGRKVQPPRTKAGRDLLQHLLGRLDQVSTGLNEVRNVAGPHLSPSAPSSALRPDTPSTSSTLAVPQRILAAVGQVESEKTEIDGNNTSNGVYSTAPAQQAGPKSNVSEPSAAPVRTPATDLPLQRPASYQIRLKNGSVYSPPLPSQHASPLFDCTYQDIHILNEELFELYSSHPVVQEVGYFKIQVRDLPPLQVQKVARPNKDHATSFSYKVDQHGLVKVDTGKRFKFASPHLPLPMSAKPNWSLEEQRELWNTSAADPPEGTRPYIIGNPLFHDVELSPGEKLRRRGRTTLEGINTQYVYFNLTGKTITTMHREDAHVRSENLLRSGEHKFWCFVKPAFSRKLEERMAVEYPEMRRCSQALRHLSRHIPPAKLDEWGIEYTLDYCTPGQAVVTEPGTYHQVLNLGPNYAIAINMEYKSSPDMPPDYHFCDRNCPDKFAMSAEDFQIYDKRPDEQLPRTPDTMGSHEGNGALPALEEIPKLQPGLAAPPPTQPATPPPEKVIAQKASAQQPGGALEQAVPQRDGEHAPTAIPDKETAVLPPPASRKEKIVLQPAQTLGPPPLLPISESNMPPTPGPAAASKMPSQESNGVQSSITPRPFTQPNGPSPEAMSRHAQSLVSPFVQQPEPPKETQVSPPHATAYFVQTTAQDPLRSQPSFHHHGLPDPRSQLPPLRKTARMINPDREYDGDPRPSKRQRAGSYSPLVSPDLPIRGALEHISSLIRGDSAKAGSLAAEQLCGKPAFERLAHLVREWRRYSKATPIVLSQFGLIKSVEDTEHSYPELHVFLSRFFKMQLAGCVESATARIESGPPPHFMAGMLQSLGWNEDQCPKLQDYLREGKCWLTVCNGYDGLLCLIPPGSDCLNLALYKDEVARFHAMLDNDFVRKLCGAGAILQTSIWRCLELPEFIWESTTTTWMPLDRISPLLATFRVLKTNFYAENSEFYWPRPIGWTWQWPSDPSVVRPGDKACSLCPRKNCTCAEIKIPQVPRISDNGSKGPGIRSVGTHKTNDILGELVGELVPVGSCAGDWAMALRRPDLDDEPVADIYPRRMGNWVRKVRHSVDPSAMFRVMKISGRWRQMLVAVKDIEDGEEITAKYGKGFTKEQPYSLVEGLH